MAAVFVALLLLCSCHRSAGFDWAKIEEETRACKDPACLKIIQTKLDILSGVQKLQLEDERADTGAKLLLCFVLSLVFYVAFKVITCRDLCFMNVPVAQPIA